MKVKSLGHVRHLATPWTATYQAPPSMGFSGQQYWSGVPLPSPKSLFEYLTNQSLLLAGFVALSKKPSYLPIFSLKNQAIDAVYPLSVIHPPPLYLTEIPWTKYLSFLVLASFLTCSWWEDLFIFLSIG